LTERETPPGFLRLFIAVALVNLLGAMDISIVATALPVVVGEFHQTQNMSWVIVGYSLAVALLVPVYGKLADKYGASRLFAWAIGVFLAASMACGLATNFWMLTVARIIQGFGGGGLGLLPLAIISEILPERLRPKYLAPLAAVWTIAGIGGPVLGGILTDTVGWRWIFFINVPLGILALILAAGALPKHPQRHKDKLFDFETYFFFAVAAVLIVLAMHGYATSIGTGVDQSTLVLALGASVALGLFVWRTLKADNPVIPLRILANRGAITMLALGTIAAVNLFAITGFVPSVLQMGFNVNASLAGLGLMPMVLTMVATSIWSGRRISKTGHWRHLPIIGSVICLAGMLLAYFFTDAWGGWLIVLALALAAVGLGLMGQLTLTLVQAFSKAKVFGAVTASVNVSRDLTGTVVSTLAGGFFGIRVVEALTKISLPAGVSPQAVKPAELSAMDAVTHLAVNHAYIEAFRPTFLNSAVAYGLVLILAFTLPKLDLKVTHS
jgi:EmrB/QacA subfamily drug resistance transporter